MVAPEAGRPAHPLRDDPFSLFATYPTGFVDGDTITTAAPGGNRQRLAELRAIPLANLMPSLLLPEADLAKLLELVARAPSSVAQLLSAAPEAKRNQARRSLGWLAKIGLIRFTKPRG